MDHLDTIIGDRLLDGNMSCLSAGVVELPRWVTTQLASDDR